MAGVTPTASGIEAEYSSVFNTDTRAKRSGSELGLNDFLTLLAAQLSNQDMNNPTSNAEFMGQLAQFSSLQAMNELTKLNTSNYSLGLLGKEVTVAREDKNGNLVSLTGAVTGVGLFEEETAIYIGDEAYKLSELMAVGRLPVKAEETEGEEGAGESAEL